MVKLYMQKINFHKKILIDKKNSQYQNTSKKNKVDINVLLNRVKIEEKNETKKKIKILVMFCFFILASGLVIF
jgi:hypothetical protein